MPVAATEYEGKPAPGTPFDKRRRDLDEMPFLAVRNMSYIFYLVQPNPSQPPKPLMTYQETLKDRPHVKRAVLEFELREGLIVPDGTETEYFNAVQSPQGAPAMTTGYPSPGPPQPGYPAAPQPQYQGQPPPPPQGQPSPPPAPSPHQAAAAGYQGPPVGGPPSGPPPGPPPAGYQGPPGPPQSGEVAAAEPPPAPAGRKRPGPKGAGVAPPPAAPPPQPQQYQQPVPIQAPQGAPGGPPAGWAPPPAGPPAGPPQGQITHPVGPAGYPQQPQQQALTAVDLGPLMQTIDRMGGGLATTSKDVEMVKGQVAELKTLVLSNLVALQYIIGQYPSLAEWFKTNGFDVYQMTVNDFLKFLATRIPR